jgi:hypothetical protein
MVEDTARNLRPAKALGMATVLVDPVDGADREGVDYVVERAADVARVVDELSLAPRVLGEDQTGGALGAPPVGAC